ncbi:MAG: choice-of-anchor D domain-containing protein, partial [Betaproteobacteria bacterium]
MLTSNPVWLFHRVAAASMRRSLQWLSLLCAVVVAGLGHAGEPAIGMALFNNVPDSVISCGNASCHGPNPNDNVNRVQRGGNNSGVILAAIKAGVTQMMFMNGLLNPFQLDDIAAYLAPQPSLSGEALDFPAQTVGTAGAAQAVTLSSIGGTNLALAAITVGGANAADFILGGTCAAGANLGSITVEQSGGSCTVTAAFAPTATGPRSATVTLAYGGSSTYPGTQTI